MPSSENQTVGKFSGRARRMQTRWSVRAADVVARTLISIGGIGTIIAVSLVFVFLAYVVFPLFYPPASAEAKSKLSVPWSDDRPVKVGIDEYQTMGWSLFADGTLDVFRLDNGKPVRSLKLFDSSKLSAASFTSGGEDVALGFEDGTVRFGKIGFETTFLDRGQVPPELHDLEVGGVAVLNEGVVQKTPRLQYRLQHVSAELKPAANAADAAIAMIDHVPFDTNAGGLGRRAYKCVVLSADHKLLACELEEKENQFTGEMALETKVNSLPFESSSGVAPLQLLISGRGDNVFVVWENGQLLRYDVRDLEKARVCETVDLLGESGDQLTACQFLLGRETIVCADSRGGLRAWFRVRLEDPKQNDGFRLAMVHELPSSGSAITSLGTSKRSRMLAAGYADGSVRVFHVTTNRTVIELDRALGSGRPVTNVEIAPKDDGLMAANTDSMRLWRFDPKFPEATMASLFLPVWYEGYDKPEQIWQSSFSGVESEMKLGLGPLIFGTLKATFYCMLFGAPLALLAAVYTSEFAGAGLRAKVKPGIEMMASLPSVVLGFLAALVFAPWIESFVPATLASFVTVPLTYLIVAFLWLLIPHTVALRIGRYRLAFAFLLLPLGFAWAWLAGPMVEKMFFAGDVKRWLDGQIGTGTGAWLILFFPLCALVTWLVFGRVGNAWLRRKADGCSRRKFAALNLLKFVTGACAAIVSALVLSWGLTSMGFDARGTYVDTYVQRNALVVGFVMGFAVIPIIYTIADDALSTVPKHLRSASLGAGATPWQTAFRIVIPTAMSGLFSALMIGLGRAVGETMIVLMAGGNTPVTEWNVFNGFRTLAANIAVELPEAVRDSTHYRTLFLAALTLFLLTFVINTAAEAVRLRFRRRAFQL